MELFRTKGTRLSQNRTNSIQIVRGRSDKYLASPLEGATIAREIYYRVAHSRRRVLSKFQLNQIGRAHV